MKFTLVKGVPERLEEYREVFYGSKLYDAYFAEGDSLNENLLRAMAEAATPGGASSSPTPDRSFP